MNIIPNQGDVISLNEPASSPTGSRTFTYGELVASLERHSQLLHRLSSTSAECRYLSEQGGGWKKAKIQLRFEITLEEDAPN